MLLGLQSSSEALLVAERSFSEDKKLRAGAGEVFKGEGILAITKRF